MAMPQRDDPPTPSSFAEAAADKCLRRTGAIEAIKRRAQPLRAARRSAAGTPYGGWLSICSSQELLQAFKNEAQLTMRPRLLLSAAVSGDPHVVQKAYEARLLGR